MRALLDKLLQYRIVRFALTGGMATAIHIAVAFSYLHIVQDSVLFANIAGFSIAFIFSYFAQTILVFKHKVNWGNAAKFFMVQFGALMISQGVSELFSDLNSYIRVLVVVVILPVVTYLIHKIWTFSDDKNTAAH
ncbi:GtrA family protein [Vibrio mediterranei]|uniref:Polysaccharide synthesis protein GtrA n=1 Tax=Vibrio mediterranei TaxID=689 RepID=A0AAN1FEN7_9VIBR|nr:GtrA family protein [Vibrio mediterranei]ASI89269.1 polysaccharide synthesis protein GtrA [Vibrio mediterranei]